MRFIKRKKILIPLAALLILLIAFLGWDHYMRTSWDNHIITSAPSFYSYKGGDRSGFPLTKSEYASLPKLYKNPIEIVKRDGAYYWANNGNLQLNKTIKYFPNKDFKWIVFATEDKAVEIEIQGNHYLTWNEAREFGCFSSDWSGNVYIKYKLDQDVDLFAYATVLVYDHIIQYFYCK